MHLNASRSESKTAKSRTGLLRMAIYSLAILTLAAEAAARAQNGLELIQTIPLTDVKGRFDHFSIDAQGPRLFVAALGNNTVEVIDLKTGKRLQSISGMSKPQGVLYLPSAKLLLVANGEDGSLKAIDASGFGIKHNVPNLPDADNVRLDPHFGNVWVGYGDGALAELTPLGDELISTIQLPGHPESFQLEKTGSRIFVNVPGAKQIAVIDAKNRKTIAAWPMEKFQANFPMALDESKHRLFVGCRKPARLVIFDTESGKQLQDLQICGDTDDLFYDAKRKRVYVCCGEGFIDVIVQEPTGVYNSLARIPTASGARTCFFSPDLDRLYLAVPHQGKQPAEIRVFKPQ